MASAIPLRQLPCRAPLRACLHPASLLKTRSRPKLPCLAICSPCCCSAFTVGPCNPFPAQYFLSEASTAC
ncbi:hypothetical protein CFC21_001435, partial [Triticum aestivum]